MRTGFLFHHLRFTKAARDRVRLTPMDDIRIRRPRPDWQSTRGRAPIEVESVIEPDKGGWRWTNRWLEYGMPNCMAYIEWFCKEHPSPGTVTGWRKTLVAAEMERRKSLHLMNIIMHEALSAENHRVALRHEETMLP